MTSLARTTTRGASVVLLTIALAACGSSGSKSAATTAAKSTTTLATTTTSAEKTSAPATSTTSASTTTAVSQPDTSFTTPSTVVARGGGAFCTTIADSYNTGITQSSAASTPAALRKLVEEGQKKSKAALASAPGEIKADVATLFAASDKLIAALDKADYDFSKVSPSATSELSTPAVQAASGRVLAFVKKDCGIDLGSSSSSSSGSGSAPATTVP